MPTMAEVPKPDEMTARVLLALTPAQKQDWQEEANRQGVSLSALIRHAMAEYMDTLGRAKKSRKKSR